MTSAQLDQLRAEFADVVIGPKLEQLLYSVAEALAPTYPPVEYTPGGEWNPESIRDAAHDWITYRLLERGDLGVILGSARDDHSLRGLLNRSFRQHLINKRVTSSATNLFDRMLQTLRQGFTCVSDVGSVGESRWAASETVLQPASADVVTRLVRYAGTRTDEELGVVRYGPYSLKSSPILRGPQLRELIGDLLKEADGSVTAGELFAVLRHRFNLVTLPPKDISDLLDAPSAAVSLHSSAPSDSHTVAAAQLVRAELTDRQLEDLKALAEAESVGAAAAALGRTRYDLQRSLEALFAVIASHAESYEDAKAIHQIVLESLYLRSDDR